METNNIPKHIGIIMDGNRRWAKSKMLPVKLGHKQGAETLKKLTRYANKIGIDIITVFAFSTENWKRSEDEVNALMSLLETYLDDFAKEADTENIVIRVLGNVSAFSKSLQESIERTVKRTENNTGTILNICLNYGGRDEIVCAVKAIANEVKKGKLELDDIDEEIVSNHMYTKNIPDPDLIIRTSGEMRLSGFLIWQSVYSEILFVEKLWPDFLPEDLDAAIEEYKKRNKRYGA